jgi:hypothetical protein
MSYEKDVYKDVKGNVTVERKSCNPSELPLTSRYVERYWFDAIKTVGAYEKQRGLVGRHLLLSDNRIEAGLKLYQNKHIEQATITTERGGDALIYVLSKDCTKRHIVVVKNFLPVDGKTPQFAYQREIYISNLQTSCDCEDYIISGRYKNNATLLCSHQIAAFFYLQNKWNMPKIFLTIEDKMFGYKKSEIEEIETEIDALPLIKFTQSMNILLLKNYRGMTPALGVSIHRIDNETHMEMTKPQWLTFTEGKDVRRIILGLLRVYNAMTGENKIIADEQKETSRKSWWRFWEKYK